MLVETYIKRGKTFRSKAEKLKKQLGGLSFVRLLFFLLFVYFTYWATQTGAAITIIGAALLFVTFLVLINLYGKLQQKTQYFTALAAWNEREAQFLQTNKSVYEVGKEYEAPHHPFSYDLDLFSEGGLYGYLNRCSTSFGKAQLAKDLLQPDISLIQQKQDAVKELAEKIDFRQQLYAHGSLHQTKKRDLVKLMQWIDGETKLIDKRWYYFLMIFPVAAIASLSYYFITEIETALSIFFNLFVLNLIIAGAFAKKITAPIIRVLIGYQNLTKF